MKPSLNLSRELLRDVYQKWFAREEIRQEFAEWQKHQAREPCASPTQSRAGELCVGPAQSQARKSRLGPQEALPQMFIKETIMVDESSQQLIRVTMNTARLLVREIVFGLVKAAQSMQQPAQPSQHIQGEQSPQDLNAQGRELKIMNLPESHVEELRSELNKYGVDFAVKPNGASCEVLYKFQDVAQIEAAVQNVLHISAADLSRSGKEAAKSVVQAATKTPLSTRLAAAAKTAAERNAAAPAQQQEHKHTKDSLTH